MDLTVGILLGTFILSVLALFFFIWSMAQGLFGSDKSAATEIFARNEFGIAEDPAATAQQYGDLQQEMDPNEKFYDYFDEAMLAATRERLAVRRRLRDDADRIRADDSSAGVVGVCLTLAVVWLVFASLAGLISSIKLHAPDWWVQYDWLTFGRMRAMHTSMVAYGWCSLAGIGVSLWLIPRLLKTVLVGTKYALAGGALWTVGVFAGTVAIGMGHSDGLEWLEFPWQIDILLVIGGALVGFPLWLTLLQRKVKHLYVSVWYIGAGLLWFPILFVIANWPGMHFGVQQATMNWWFGHNVLGLWFTPLGLAAAYYFIPKVLGKPIHSYNLSLLGFWSLAFFYSQVGGHHLIGGPVPSWLITIAIVQSMMMVIPVFAVAVNQHMTVIGNFRALFYSPVLRFVVLGAIMYTAASVQGSLEALRSVNTVTHFTHYTVAHAHLGLYGFFSMVMFGSIYFIMPRVMNWEWPFPVLISLHFWLVLIGFSIYFIWLSIGGWLQGLAMLDEKTPFMQSVALTLPYLQARSIGGGLMTLGHLVFAAHFFAMGWKFGPKRLGAALLEPSILLRALNKRAAA
jgi:cytochrome c oxidase cbb3-type subunit 1